MKKPLRVHKETLPDAMTELGLVWDIFDASDMWVASFKTEALALEIVRAVNAHEALVGACEFLISSGPTSHDIGKAFALASSALTLAKEPT